MVGWWRKLFMRKSISPLKQELQNLQRNHARDDQKLAVVSARFWKEGGVCCPSCGVHGYAILVLKQERRERRMQEIDAKLRNTRRPVFVR